MSWPTRLFESRDAWEAAGFPVGGVYPAPWLLDPSHAGHADLAPRYRDGSAGVPHFVCLPGGGCWSPWCLAHDEARGNHGDGWDVSGPPQRLTAHPSIDAIGSYHGWLRDGLLTDDCEGRRYEPDGKRQL